MAKKKTLKQENNKQNRKKNVIRFIVFILVFLLIGGALFSSLIYVFADNVTSMESELDDINSDIAALQKKINEGKSEANSLSSEIKSVEKKIYNVQKQINALTSQVNDTKKKITDTLNELETMQQSMENQNNGLNNRIRAMYKSGDISTLSIVLGSSTITELLTNMELAKRIYKSDETLLSDMQTEYDAVELKKQELQTLKSELVDQQNELKKSKESLAAVEASLEKEKKSVESNNKQLEAQIDALNAEAEKLTEEIKKLQSKEEYTGGTMCWPSKASSRITSPFGNRLHPILKVNKLHTGIDIGAGSGTDILAANDGTVITSAYNAGGYGYYLIVDHGGGIVTLYAHCSKLLVKKGAKVTRGQVIAKVGSTGMSTGAHLHFEVRVNGKYVDPLGYVTAGKY